MNTDTLNNNTLDNNSMDDGPQCDAMGKRDQVVMRSGGTIEADCPNYIEEDDVKGSIAEGYF